MARQVADVIRDLRDDGAKPTEIARRIGVSYGTVRRWELGAQGVSPDHAAAWREHYGQEVVVTEPKRGAPPVLAASDLLHEIKAVSGRLDELEAGVAALLEHFGLTPSVEGAGSRETAGSARRSRSARG